MGLWYRAHPLALRGPANFCSLDTPPHITLAFLKLHDTADSPNSLYRGAIWDQLYWWSSPGRLFSLLSQKGFTQERQWQDSLISQHDSLKHLESLKDVPWCKVWDTVLDSGPNAAKYASSVFNILSWALFGDRLCRHCSQPIPTDQSLFEHISQVHLSMKPSSIINSLKDLSDPENFATAIEFLFDVGHKFCLLHVQN